MIRRLASRLLAALFSLVVLAACSTLGRGARPADLSGPWTFVLQPLPDRETRGEFTLVRQADGYTGELTTSVGNQRLPVRSVEFVRDSITMRVESPQGMVVFRGLVDPSRQAMEGKVWYHTGAVFPMRVRRGT